MKNINNFHNIYSSRGIGILKNKVPKWSSDHGFATEVKFYLFFYLLVIMGVVLFILKISAST